MRKMDNYGHLWYNLCMNEPKKVLQFGRKHAAHLIHVSEKTVYRWIQAEKIFAYQVGGRGAWYIPLPEINRMREVHQLPSLTAAEAINELETY